MAKPDPALLKLVREAFVVLGDNTETMKRLNAFVEDQQKKTTSRMKRSDFCSLKSIYLKQDSD